MNDLFIYVSAIKNNNHGRFVVERTLTDDTFEEDGIVTEYKEQTVTFSNGVIIKQCIELEQGEVSQDAVCPECWIGYEVLSEPYGLNIFPKRKNFVSKCQESFWLKINATRTNT